MTLVQKLESAAKVVKGRVWGVDIGKPRIYLFCRRKDARVFFDFPEHAGDDLGDAVLRCSIDDNGWHNGKWYSAQKKIILAQYEQQCIALTCWLNDKKKGVAV
jgi:hypothetical protein